METRRQLASLKDKELLMRYQSGQSLAFEVLVQRHRSKIMSSILNIVKDRDVAEDLYQDTLIKVVHIMENQRYQEEGKYLPWALRVARNLSIDHFRREKRNQQLNSQTPSANLENVFRTEDNAERALIRKENQKYVRELINRLPRKQREVLILRHYNDLSFKEIAEKTNVSINTALGRMRYALINLKKLAEGGEIAA